MSGITSQQALEILHFEGPKFVSVLTETNSLRHRAHGPKISLCSIVNAKSGNCSQDCAFCAQSSRSKATINKYRLIEEDEMVRAAMQAKRSGAHRFSIVTSGRRIKPGQELETIVRAIRRIRQETSLGVCASLGCVEPEVLKQLKIAGLSRYHHNLETAPTRWASICTTRPYEDSHQVIRAAHALGLEVCSGGIFGMGESLDQRIELLAELRSLPLTALALNFFTPVTGTPLDHVDDLTPLACLKIVAAARLMMPLREIRVCGGRERNLRDLQVLLPMAGGSGIMVGGYLTTPGRNPENDVQMIRDLGLEPEIGVEYTEDVGQLDK